MLAHKALRVLGLLFILIGGIFIPALYIPPVLADDSTGQTTLYFTEALSYLESENFTDTGFITMSQYPPTKQNDSEYPPNLLIKNTSKFLPRPALNTNQWFTWFSSWLFYLFPEFNLSGIPGFEGFELFLPSPLRVVEGYNYNGTESVPISGDIRYNLYFSSEVKFKKYRDQVEVKLYSMNMESLESMQFFPKLIANTTVSLTPKFFDNVYKQQIILPDVTYTLKPGDSLLFSIEIIPSNKTLPTLITKYVDVDRVLTRWEKRANWLENRSNLKKLQTFGTTLKDIISIIKEGLINITSDDFAAIINAMRSSSFVYDSVQHPSSVSIPAQISAEDIRIYFLGPNREMITTQNDGANASKTKILTTPTIWTANQGLERNKILKIQDITAELYFSRFLCLLPRKVSVTVTLYDDNTTIASSQKQLTKNELQGFLRKKITPVVFNFTGVDREITYGHKLGIGISLSNGTRSVRTPLYLQPTSSEYPSLLRVKFEETQNIQIHDLITTPPEGKIIPGGSIQYLLNVTSIKSDILQINIIERGKTGAWSLSTPTSVTVSAGSWVIIPVYVNSSNVLKEAYGSIIDLIVVITGNTGIARQAVTAEISEDAIGYNVEILGYSNTINISKGENRFFYFVVKNDNTGAIDDTDSYTITASSQNDWRLIPQETIRNLGIGDTTDADDARVLIEVPKNATEKSDTITITVTSDSSSDASATITITVNVLGGDFIEELLNFFDSAARTLGLNDLFGSDGKFVLLIILVVIILFFIIILAFVFTSKPVRIICTDRIREIESTEKAIFEVILKNPYKKTQTYEIEAQPTTPSSKWEITVDPTTTEIEGKASKTLQVIVTPTDSAEPKEWTQVTVSVKKTGKKKKESIDLVTMMKEGKKLLQLQNVSHWPTTFNPGEKIVTSFSLSNDGTIAARNVKIFFYLNGKQKNKVEVTLPAGNFADIQIPWIAEKGKNQVRIRVKE
jgi:hypothetical protein